MAKMKFNQMADRYWRAIRKGKKDIPTNALQVVTAMPGLIKDLNRPEINLTEQGKRLIIECADMLHVHEKDPELYANLKELVVH